MTVPFNRLTAADLYGYVDRAESAFADGDELDEVERAGRLRLVSTIDERIRQLERVIAHIRDPHYSAAMELVGSLKRARISRSVDLPEAFERLRQVTSDWDAVR